MFSGNPRKLMLSIVGDRLNYFTLANEEYDENTGILSAVVVKSEGTVLDRETERILTDGGLYAFQVRAREIFNDDEDGIDLRNVRNDEIATVTNVTVIVTDVNDQIPTFNRNNFTIPVSEEVCNITEVKERVSPLF